MTRFFQRLPTGWSALLASTWLAGFGNSWSASAQSTHLPPRADFQAYRIILDRNIFNPNRSAAGSPQVTPSAAAKPARTESFRLLGIMSYEKGHFAFFDGSTAQYRKVVESSQTIAGFKLVEVSNESVQLESNGPPITLTIGMAMKREDEGPWKVSVASESPASSLTSSSSNKPARTDPGEDDILKRLMERREKE